MPKKTRKEKALAQARRLIQNARIQSSSVSHQPIPQVTTEVRVPASTFRFKEQPVAAAVSAKTTASDEQEFKAIRKDILKTVVLAGVAIAFECIVYLKFGT